MFTPIKCHREKGLVTLMVALIVLASMTLAVVATSNVVRTEQKVYSNSYRNKQALAAAEAGLEYAIQAITANKSNYVVDDDGDGFMNANTLSGSLGNSASYSANIINPVANDFDLLEIRSVGSSDDGRSTREIRQSIQWHAFAVYLPEAALIAKQEANLTGNASAINLAADYTIWSGSATDFNGNASSMTATAMSDKFYMDADVQQNDAGLSNSSSSAFFANFFGASKDAVDSSTDVYISANGNQNHSSQLNNVQGKTIWIEQSAGKASINGTTTIGSANNPVILIVNGELQINGNTTIYGLVYAGNADVKVNGNFDIHGMLIAETNLDASGNFGVQYDTTVLNNLNQLGYFGKIPGSWNDLKL